MGDRMKADWTVAGRATVREADLIADENIVVYGQCVCTADVVVYRYSMK